MNPQLKKSILIRLSSAFKMLKKINKLDIDGRFGKRLELNFPIEILKRFPILGPREPAQLAKILTVEYHPHYSIDGLRKEIKILGDFIHGCNGTDPETEMMAIDSAGKQLISENTILYEAYNHFPNLKRIEKSTAKSKSDKEKRYSDIVVALSKFTVEERKMKWDAKIEKLETDYNIQTTERTARRALQYFRNPDKGNV